MSNYLLAIDQGTTSTRAILFDHSGKPIAQQQKILQQYFPQNGWVEHDPEEIWQATLTVIRNLIKSTQVKLSQVAGIGITNQRETTVLWHRHTGRPIYNAIVWQDRRTAAACDSLKNKEAIIQAKTGLLLDPYFSATKIAWILDHVAEARELAAAGELAFGTIDSFLLWHLTGGKLHATDATNASRTALFNIHTNQWDPELLQLFNIPENILPKVLDNCADFTHTVPELFGAAIPIRAMAGDQQAALIGQACFKPGSLKSTYGTGCFMLLNTGEEALSSQHRLLTTIGYRLNGKITYALEGSIFAAGTIVQWLRDQLGLIKSAADSETLAQSLQDNGGVYFIPAFTGLGAPYWNPHVRGTMTGLTRDTQAAHIVRAGLEAIAYQSRDLLQAMQDDGAAIKELKVDGGMVNNNWLMQFLADILAIPVVRAETTETTALGVAYLAGLQAGVFSSLDDIAALQQSKHTFLPTEDQTIVQKWYKGWKQALNLLLK